MSEFKRLGEEEISNLVINIGTLEGEGMEKILFSLREAYAEIDRLEHMNEAAEQSRRYLANEVEEQNRRAGELAAEIENISEGLILSLPPKEEE